MSVRSEGIFVSEILMPSSYNDMDMKGYYTGYKFHVCFFRFAMPLYCLYRDFNFTASMKESPHIPVAYPAVHP